MKILVVEDNERVAELINRGLTNKGFQVKVAYDAESAWSLIQKIDYDLVITDVMLPRMNGIQLSKNIKTKFPQLPIIMLTALGQIDEKITGFDAGVDDYMVKPFEIRELYARIMVIVRRRGDLESPYNQEELTFEDIHINLNNNQVRRGDQYVKLTKKELSLLIYFMKHPNKMLTREDIARNVWGKDFDTGTNYIDVYINYLRNKIDKDFEKRLIHTRSGIGFILSSNP